MADIQTFRSDLKAADELDGGLKGRPQQSANQ